MATTSTPADLQTIGAQDLKETLERGGNVALVNVLSADSFAEKRIPGSINIPVDELRERAPKELPNKNMRIIVHCSNRACTASPTAARTLQDMGYTNVLDFEEGLQGWEEAGYGFEGSG